MADEWKLLDDATIEYGLRCGANWIEERSGPDVIDMDDERGRILRWNRDHPDSEA